MSKERETPPMLIAMLWVGSEGLGMLIPMSEAEIELEESEIPSKIMNIRMITSLMTMFQMGWKMSEQFSAMTCAASLMQLMASLMYLQLMITKIS